MSIPTSDRAAIKKIINGLIQRGVTIDTARDGANEDLAHTKMKDTLDWLTSCDESVLFVTGPEGEKGHIYFVLGNDPEEVACDYTVNLSDYIDPIIEPWWN